MTTDGINPEEVNALENLMAVTKYVTAINMLAEAFENEFVAEQLAPACTEMFFSTVSLNLRELETLLCTSPVSSKS
jgi:hypothetical protein